MKVSSPNAARSSEPRCGARWSRALVATGVLLACGWTTLQAACSARQESFGPPVVRRLTEPQYRATITDIFGADVPIVGRFERGLRSEGLLAVGTSRAGISPFSVEQYDASALGVAEVVVSEERRGELVPCQPESETRFDPECATRFVEHYGRLLFRRPMTSEETARFVEAALAGHTRLGNFYSGLQFALAGMMVSPEFLLRIERVEPDPARPGDVRLDAYSRATRLSYFLTNSTPDDELLRAAGAGELDTQDGLERQVDRLIDSERFERAVRTFFEDMLQFDLFEDLAKDPVIYPAFNSVGAADAAEQTLRTILDHLLDQQGDYRELFTIRKTDLTRKLGILYSMPVRTRNGWEPAEFAESGGRAGIHTHISFLALHSHPGRSSATLRGVALREIFLCQEVPEAPAAVGDFTVFEDTSNKAVPTARDRLEVHRTEPTCASCHRIMDPLGLALENFDGAGGFRTHENGAPIDAGGSLDGRELDGAIGLGQALHDHQGTTECLVDKLYRFAVGRDTILEERWLLKDLHQSFEASGYRLQDLARAIALDRSFHAVSMPSNQAASSTHADAQTSAGDQS